MRLILLLASLGLGLAACSNGEDRPAEVESTAATTPVVIGGVDLNEPLRALGTEPFWGVDITPETLVYSSVDQPGLTVRNPGATVQGTTAVYAGAGSNGTTLVVTLIATECSDGMSDRVYPLTARVEMGSQTLTGCAASVAFLESEPRP